MLIVAHYVHGSFVWFRYFFYVRAPKQQPNAAADAAAETKSPAEANDDDASVSSAAGPKKKGTVKQRKSKRRSNGQRRKSLVKQADEAKTIDRLMRQTDETGTTLRHIEDASIDDFLYGCGLAEQTWKTLKSELGWTNRTPPSFFCHQVGTSYRKTLFKALDLEVERDHPTLEWLGNIGSVSLPISMALAERDACLKKGDFVAMLGIGSGLNCMMLGVEW